MNVMSGDTILYVCFAPLSPLSSSSQPVEEKSPRGLLISVGSSTRFNFIISSPFHPPPSLVNILK